ncbi:MAG: restriction endonuclease subunit S [bacterium]
MECFTILSGEIENRLDPHFYRPEFKELKNNLLKQKHKLLGEVIDFSSETWNQKDFFDNEFPYIEISEIDTSTGEIQNITYYEKNKAPSRAKMIVRENDIIVSTTRPHRGAIASIDKAKNGFIASTGFAILRDLKIELNKKYLYVILRTQLSLKQMLQRSSGGNYPAITTEELKKLIIPLPPISTQERIVTLIESAYFKNQQKESEAQKLLDSINDYVLNELGIKPPELKDKMIYVVDSDEVENNRIDAHYYEPKFEEVEKAVNKGKYEVKELKDVADKLLSGQRPKGGVRQISEGIPSLGGEHVLSDGKIATTELKFIPKEFHKKRLMNKIQKKDIIIVKDGATTGKVGILPEDYPFEEVNINEHVFLLRVKREINPYYVFSILKSQLGQMQINRNVTGGTIMGIIRETTESLKIPLAPLAVQNKIAEEVKRRMQKAELLQKDANDSLEKAKKEVEYMIMGKKQTYVEIKKAKQKGKDVDKE